jgi:hypothetical protein
MSGTIIVSLIAGSVLLMVAACLIVPWLHRRQLARWLHERGCEIRTVRRAQVGRVGWDRRQACYYVEFADQHGKTRRQLCILTGQIAETQDIFWRDIQPDDLLPGDWQCFECRARIPKGESVCPECGWS